VLLCEGKMKPSFHFWDENTGSRSEAR
jgi:hypothetical protein